MINSLILNEIEAIDEVVNESKIDQLMTIASIYDKQFTIIEEYQYRNKSDVSGFNIFQESFYQEGEILDKATGKGKDESMLAKIVAFIPRLVGAIIDSIKKLFSGDSKKKAEEAAEKASKFSPQKLAKVGGILGAAGLGFIGGKALSNNSKEDSETVKKNDELTKANQDLTEKNKNLTDENNNLKTSIAEKDKQFEAEMKELKKQIKSLSESELAKDNARLEEVRRGLIKQVRAAADKNRDKRDRDVKEVQGALNIKIDQWNEIRREYLKLQKSHNKLQNDQQALSKSLNNLRTNQKEIIESIKGSPLSNDDTVLDFVNVLNDTIEGLSRNNKIAAVKAKSDTKKELNEEHNKQIEELNTKIEGLSRNNNIADAKAKSDAKKEYDKQIDELNDEYTRKFEAAKQNIVRTLADYIKKDNDKKSEIETLKQKIENLEGQIKQFENASESDNDSKDSGNDKDPIDDLLALFQPSIPDNDNKSENKKDQKIVSIPVNKIEDVIEKTTDSEQLTVVADIVVNADAKRDTNQDTKIPIESSDNLKKLREDIGSASTKLKENVNKLYKLEKSGKLGKLGKSMQRQFYDVSYMSEINEPFSFDLDKKQIYSRINFRLLIDRIDFIKTIIYNDFDDAKFKAGTMGNSVKEDKVLNVYTLSKQGIRQLYQNFTDLEKSLTTINDIVREKTNRQQKQSEYDDRKKEVIKIINQMLSEYTSIISELCYVITKQMTAFGIAVNSAE